MYGSVGLCPSAGKPYGRSRCAAFCPCRGVVCLPDLPVHPVEMLHQLIHKPPVDPDCDSGEIGIPSASCIIMRPRLPRPQQPARYCPFAVSRSIGSPLQLVVPWVGSSCGWATVIDGWMLSPGVWPSTELLPSWQPPGEHKYRNPIVPVERGCEITVRETALPVSTCKPTNSWFVTTRFQILLFSPVITPLSQFRTILDSMIPPWLWLLKMPKPFRLDGRQSWTRTSLIL